VEKYLKFIKDSAKKAKTLSAPPAELKNRQKESARSAVAAAMVMLQITGLPVHAEAEEAIAADLAEHN
jgi:hypothetical protein